MIIEKRIRIQNIPIHISISGDAPKAIVFIHGNSSSSEMWNDQLSDASLNEHYKLVAMDLPGHGNSGKSNDYSMKKIASMIPALISALDLEAYILVGLSFGTCLIGEAAQWLKGCKGFVLVSPNLTNNTYKPQVYLRLSPELAALSAASVDDAMLEEYANMLMYNSQHTFTQEYINSYINTDPDFRLGIGKIIEIEDWTDEFANITNTGLQACIVFGKEEKAIDINYMNDFPANWQSQVFQIPGAAHFPNVENPETFNKLLLDFANDVLE